MISWRVLALTASAVAMTVIARPARAQGNASVTLTVASAGTAFPTPTAADYLAGYIDNPVTLAFSGQLKGPAGTQSFTGYVEVCALAADLGNGKALSDLQWRPADLSLPFQSVVLGCDGAVSTSRLVGSYTLAKSQSLRNFSGGIILRLTLRWTDSAASYGVALGFTTSMTQP